MQRTDGAVSRMNAVHGLFLPMMLFCALLPACSSKSFADIRAGIETRGHYIENVPFVRQGDSDCGPAALAGVFAYWKQPVDLKEIASTIYLPRLHGTLSMDMQRYAEQTGFHTTAVEEAEALRGAVRNDRPVICMLDLGFGPYRRPHYITVIGYDEANRVFIIHNGEQANAVMSYDNFEAAWARAGHWALVVTPK